MLKHPALRFARAVCRSRVRVLLTRCGVLAACLLYGASVSAQASPGADKAVAEALFDRGLTLMRQGQFEQACAQLEQSQSIERGIGTMLYLAECYEKLGKTASAWAMFREAASAARAENQLDRAKTGSARADRLEPTLSRLTVNVAGAATTPGLVVTRNGQTVPNGAYGVALPSDPGEQRIEARAPGRSAWSSVVELGANAAMLVVDVPELVVDAHAVQPVAAAPVSEPGELEAQPAPASVTAATPAPAEPRSSWQRPLGFVLGGAGIVALGVGTYFGLRAIDTNGDLEAACKTEPCSASARPLQDSANSAATASTVLVIGGAALLGAGAILLWTAPRERALTASLQGEVGGARLQLRGRF